MKVNQGWFAIARHCSWRGLLLPCLSYCGSATHEVVRGCAGVSSCDGKIKKASAVVETWDTAIVSVRLNRGRGIAMNPFDIADCWAAIRAFFINIKFYFLEKTIVCRHKLISHPLRHFVTDLTSPMQGRVKGRAGLKGGRTRGNLHWRAPMASSFVKFMFSLIRNVLVCVFQKSIVCLPY